MVGGILLLLFSALGYAFFSFSPSASEVKSQDCTSQGLILIQDPESGAYCAFPGTQIVPKARLDIPPATGISGDYGALGQASGSINWTSTHDPNSNPQSTPNPVETCALRSVGSSFGNSMLDLTGDHLSCDAEAVQNYSDNRNNANAPVTMTSTPSTTATDSSSNSDVIATVDDTSSPPTQPKSNMPLLLAAAGLGIAGIVAANRFIRPPLA